MFSTHPNFLDILKTMFCCTVLTLAISGCSKESETTSFALQSTSSNILTKLNDLHPLKDTGITWAGKFPKHNQQDCSPEPSDNETSDDKGLTAAQDCMHGTDKLGVATSYQKISDAGETLDVTAVSWSCVLDKSTGLLWESKIPMDRTYGNNGLQDADDVFTWYSNNSSNNGGAVGDWSQGLNVCAGYLDGQPTTFCNTEEFTRRVNEKGLCGFKDWRLPSRFELEYLVNYGNTGVRIDTDYFPGTHPEFYWSSTPGVANHGAAWAVNFSTGNTSLSSRQSSFPVRLVRSTNQ